jgi:signal transduction histidine kinase
MKITSKNHPTLQSLKEDQINAIEMHSFLNLINVVSLQLELLNDITERADLFDPILKKTDELITGIQNKDKKSFLPDSIRGFQETVFTLFDQLELDHLDEKTLSEIHETKRIFLDVFIVMTIRSQELLDSITKPGEWKVYTIEQFKKDFNEFFHAVEKNSKGRYRIVQNIAKQESNDYLVTFDVDSDQNDQISMPLLFKDVIRDLIANARKYTAPGGQIHVGIYQKNNLLRFIVEDNGMGIPADELHRVFDYGYRAKNVQDKPTMGGGFGLTKALYITGKLQGDIWIDSEEGVGTKIKIEIPTA